MTKPKGFVKVIPAERRVSPLPHRVQERIRTMHGVMGTSTPGQVLDRLLVLGEFLTQECIYQEGKGWVVRVIGRDDTMKLVRLNREGTE